MLKQILQPLLCAALLATLASAAQAKETNNNAIDSWLQKYGAAWEARDAGAAGKLFTETAIYQDMPFDSPRQGRAAIEEYWRTVTQDQRDIQFESKLIAVNGTTGVAHWSATFKSNGATVALDGVFVLEFDAAGQCTSLREWWHVKTG